MRDLPIFVQLAGRKVVLLGDGEVASARRRLIERAGAEVVAQIAPDVRLGFVAIVDPLAAAAAAERLRAAGLLVNVADQPDLCDFTLGALVERGPVTIAIGTGGASAGLAAALRQRLERLLPERLGAIATLLGGAKAALRHAFPDGIARRRAVAAMLAEGGVLDPLGEGALPDEMAGTMATMATNGHMQVIGILEEIILTSDKPDDLTLRAARLLAGADILWHQQGVSEDILHRARADAPRRLSEARPPVPESGVHIWLRRPPA